MWFTIAKSGFKTWHEIYDISSFTFWQSMNQILKILLQWSSMLSTLASWQKYFSVLGISTTECFAPICFLFLHGIGKIPEWKLKKDKTAKYKHHITKHGSGLHVLSKLSCHSLSSYLIAISGAKSSCEPALSNLPLETTEKTLHECLLFTNRMSWKTKANSSSRLPVLTLNTNLGTNVHLLVPIFCSMSTLRAESCKKKNIKWPGSCLCCEQSWKKRWEKTSCRGIKESQQLTFSPQFCWCLDWHPLKLKQQESSLSLVKYVFYNFPIASIFFFFFFFFFFFCFFFC